MLSQDAHRVTGQSVAMSGPRPPNPSPEQAAQPRPTILLIRPIPARSAAVLAAKYDILRPWESPLPFLDFLETHAAHVTALVSSLLAPVNAPTLRVLPALRFVLTTSAGLEHIDLGECRRRGVAVTCAGTVFSDDVADYAVGLLLDVLRKISSADRFVRRGEWVPGSTFPLGSRLGSRSVGIVGLGSIGLETARRLQGFGCRILYYSRAEKSNIPFLYYPSVIDLAAECDVLIVSCSLNSETYHIINKDVLAALGKEGVVINVGRGALVDEKELVRSLVGGEIAGAGLDVFEDEPNVPHELLELDNVVLSAHRAVVTVEGISDVYNLMIANLDAFFANKPLLTPVQL